MDDRRLVTEYHLHTLNPVSLGAQPSPPQTRVQSVAACFRLTLHYSMRAWDQILSSYGETQTRLNVVVI